MKNKGHDNSKPGRSFLNRLLLSGKWRRATSVFMALIVFITSYMMILPALTIDLDTAVQELGMEVASAASAIDMTAAERENVVPADAGASQTNTDAELTENAETYYQGDSEVYSENPGAAELAIEMSESAEDAALEEILPPEDTTTGQNVPELPFPEEIPSTNDISDSLIPADELGVEVTETTDEIWQDVTESLPTEEQETIEEVAESADLSLTDAQVIEEEEAEISEIEQESVSANVLKAEGADYRVTVSFTEEAMIPESAELQVTEILSAENDYEKYMKDAADVLSTEERIMSVDNARFFDITILDGEESVEPQAQVTVLVELADDFAASDDATVLHYTDNEVKVVETVDPDEAAANAAAGTETVMLSSLTEETAGNFEETYEIIDDASMFPEEVPVVGSATAEMSGSAEIGEIATAEELTEAGEEESAEITFDETMNPIAFVADSFSVYGFVTATIEKTILASDGHNYKVTVTCEANADISENAVLQAEEITEGTSVYNIDYKDYAVCSESALDMKEGSAEYLRLFDIKIVDKNDSEIKYQPAEGTTVDVKIELMDAESNELSVVHFEDGTKDAKKVESSIESLDEGQAVSFAADGFSVYGVVMTETISTKVITAEGETYTIEVTYDSDAGIPKGAILEAEEIPVGSSEYKKYYNEVTEKIGGETGLSYARFFDIRIISDGKEIEPNAGVETKIIYTDGVNLTENTSSAAVHFTESGVEILPVETDDAENPTTFIFTQDSFSVTGTVVTGLADGQYMIFARTANNTYYSLTHTGNGDIGSEAGSGSYGSYTGNTNDRVLWNVTAVDGGYQITTNYNGVTRYLRNRNGTLEWSTTPGVWTYNNNHLSSGNYYLRWRNNSFSVTNNVNSAGNIYFAWTNNEKNSDITVHFGEISGNGFVEWSSQKISNPTYLGQQVNLTELGNEAAADNEKTGYRYVTTKVADALSGTEIYTKLQTIDARPEAGNNINSNRYWLYRELDSVYYNYVDAGWNVWRSFADEEKDIYVIYEQSPASSQTDVPPVGDLGAPATDKNVKSNNDGTYDVVLSVTGESRASKEKTKANVVIVYDVSWSMDATVAGDGRTRKAIAEKAIKSLANQLLSLNTSTEQDSVELAFVSFAAKVTNEQEMNSIYAYNDYSSFESVINNLTYTSGTNWDAGLEAASHIQWKDSDPLYVVFVSDGDTISRSTIIDTNNAVVWDGGTYRNPYTTEQLYSRYYQTTHDLNVEAAKRWADSLKANGAKIYGVGAFGDEMQNLSQISSSGTYINATSESQLLGEFSNIINEISNSLGYSDVTINDGITTLSSTSLISGDPNEFKYYRSGGKKTDNSEKYDSTANGGRGETWTDAPQAMFLEIIREKNSTTYTFKKNGSIDTGFTNEEKNAYLDKYLTDAEREGTDELHIKTVVWDINLGRDVLLEDGVTYTIAFTVWPSQKAYDLIADLNNGIIQYNSLEQSVRDQIYELNGVYYLKTNTRATVDYISQRLENGQPVGTPTAGSSNIKDPNGKMNLESNKMKVKKLFADSINSVDPFTQIQFYLKVDGKYYQEDGTLSETLDEDKAYKIILPKTADNGDGTTSQVWEDDVFIAPGLMKDGDVLETGHYYTLEEKVLQGNIYEYEFTPQTVRPMVITAKDTFLLKKDKYSTNPDNKTEYSFNDSNHTYTENPEGGTENVFYVASENNGELVGTNRKTAELDITKKIIDNTGKMTDAQLDAETFTYRVMLTVPKDSNVNGINAYEYVPRTSDSYNGTTRFFVFGYQSEAHTVTVNDEAVTIPADLEGTRGLGDDVSNFNGKVYGRYTVLPTTQHYEEGQRPSLGAFFTVDAGGDTKSVTLDITLKRDEVLRFTNLPSDTAYTITEIYANKNSSDPSIDSDAIPGSESSNLAEQGYASIAVNTKHGSSSATVTGTTVTGTITDLDTRYYNQFTNTLDYAVDVELKAKKQVQGYEWSGERYYFNLEAGTADYTEEEAGTAPLPGINGRTRVYRQNAGGTTDAGYSFGRIRITKPGTYTYTISEDQKMYVLKNGSWVDAERTDIVFGGAETVTVTVVEEGRQLRIESITGANTAFTPATETTPASGMTTITNTLSAKDIKLKKVDDNGSVLSGSAFRFEKQLSDSTWTVVNESITPGAPETELTEAVQNPVSLSSLMTGRYRLTESTAPEDYIKLPSPVYFEVYLDTTAKVRLTDANGNPVQYIRNVKLDLDSDGSYIITVMNPKKTSITAEKVWYASQADTVAPVKVKLMRRIEGVANSAEQVGEEFTLSASTDAAENWKRTISDLPMSVVVDGTTRSYQYYLEETGVQMGNSTFVQVSDFASYDLLAPKYFASNTNTPPSNGWNGMDSENTKYTLSSSGTLYVGNCPDTYGQQMNIWKKWKGMNNTSYAWDDITNAAEVQEMSIIIELSRTASYTVAGEEKTKVDSLGTFKVKYGMADGELKTTISDNTTGLHIIPEDAWHVTIPETGVDNDGIRQLPQKGILNVEEVYYKADFTYSLKETDVLDADGKSVKEEWDVGTYVNTSGTDSKQVSVYVFNFRKYDLKIIKKWNVNNTDLTKQVKEIYFKVLRTTKNGFGAADVGELIYENPAAYGLTQNDVAKIRLDGQDVYVIKMTPEGADGAWDSEQSVILKNLCASMNNYAAMSNESATDQWFEALYSVEEIAYKDSDDAIKAITALTTPYYQRKVRKNQWQSTWADVPTGLQLGFTTGGEPETQVRVTNALAYDVNIMKTTENNTTPLAGAHFALYGSDYYLSDGVTVNENAEMISIKGSFDLVSGSDGLIALGMLDKGTYYLVETKAPAGYNSLSKPVKIVVDPTGKSKKTVTTGTGAEAVTTEYPLYVTYHVYTPEGTEYSLSSGYTGIAVEDSTDGTSLMYKLTVPNTSGVELPMTGGAGTARIYLCGLMLLALSGVGVVMRRRKLLV